MSDKRNAVAIRKRADLLRGLRLELPAEVYADVEHTINAWHERRKAIEQERDQLRAALTYIEGTAFAGEASPNARDFQRIMRSAGEALNG